MKTARYIKPLTIYLEPEMYDQIKQVTDAKQISMADFVRESIAVAIENKNKRRGFKNERYND